MESIVSAPQTVRQLVQMAVLGADQDPGRRPGISGLVSIPEPFIGSLERCQQLVANWHQCLAET